MPDADALDGIDPEALRRRLVEEALRDASGGWFVKGRERHVPEIVDIVLNTALAAGAVVPAARHEAEQRFLNASIAVWREIDRLSAEPGGYRGLDSSTDLRRQERAAWEAYRDALAAHRALGEGGE